MDDALTPLYRKALGTFATGVAVITVADGARTVALTVNSFTSLSLDPPLVLWSLGKASDRGVWFLAADGFTVNILGAEDGALAADCARRGQYLLAPERIDATSPERPSVSNALARLYCDTHERISLGDHVIVVGKVTAFDSRDGDGLTYFRGRFGVAPSPEQSA